MHADHHIEDGRKEVTRSTTVVDVVRRLFESLPHDKKVPSTTAHRKRKSEVGTRQ